MDLNLCISNGTVSTKLYDKRDDFDFKFRGNCTVRYAEIQIQKGASVSEELALFNWSSVGYMRSTIWSKYILSIFNKSSRYLEVKL